MRWSPEMLFLYWAQPYGRGPTYYERLYGTTPQSMSHSTQMPRQKKDGLLRCCWNTISNFIKLMSRDTRT